MMRTLILLVSRIGLLCLMMVMVALGFGRTLREDEILFWGKPGNKDFDIYRIALSRNLTMPIAPDSMPYPSLADAVWSPDGQQIAFVSQRVNEQHLQGSIFIADAAGSNPKLLIPDLDCVSNLRWSPDGAQIAVISGCYPTSLLMTVDVKRETVNYLTSNVSESYAPHWSTDGEQISFKYVELNRNISEVYNINVRSGNVDQLARMWPRGSSPVASPDGRYVVYTHNPPESNSNHPSIYLHDVTAQQTTLLYEENRFITSSIDWSSDSQFIVYAAGSLGDSELFTLDVAGCIAKTINCTPQRVIPVTGEYIDPQWRPRQP